MKYYTPTIEEFHYGFEYELKFLIFDLNRRRKEIWIKDLKYGSKFSSKLYPPCYSEANIKTTIANKKIRVKCLDKEDIESLGFVQVKEYSNLLVFQSEILFNDDKEEDWTEIDFAKDGSNIEISRWTSLGYKSNESILFDGIIKNKSELNLILRRINTKSNKEES